MPLYAVTVTCAAAVVMATGCGGNHSAVDAAGRPLPPARIYMSVPLSGTLGARGSDLADAARLALKQTKFNAGDRPLELVVRDSAPVREIATPADEPVSGDRVAATARAAAADDNALAVIGDITPEAVAIAERQTARSRNLIVSLAVAAFDPPPAGRVAARVVWLLPPEPLQAFAASQALAEIAGGQRDALTLAPTLDNPSRMVNNSKLELVSPALLPEQLPPGGARFYQQFEDEYGRRPDRFAIFAYDAVGLVDQTIQKAATDAEDRKADYGPPQVAAAGLRVRDRFSAVGHYDILPSGQSTLYQFTVRRAEEPADQRPENVPSVIEARR